jgi:hypothetical protein
MLFGHRNIIFILLLLLLTKSVFSFNDIFPSTYIVNANACMTNMTCVLNNLIIYGNFTVYGSTTIVNTTVLNIISNGTISAPNFSMGGMGLNNTFVRKIGDIMTGGLNITASNEYAFLIENAVGTDKLQVDSNAANLWLSVNTLPRTTLTYNLGATNLYFLNGYIGKIHAQIGNFTNLTVIGNATISGTSLTVGGSQVCTANNGICNTSSSGNGNFNLNLTTTTGASLTGISGNKFRNYTITNLTYVVVDNWMLHPEIDFNYSSNVATFKNAIWDDMTITFAQTTSGSVSYVNYLGSALTGSNGAGNRQLTASLTPLFVAVDNAHLHPTADYTSSGQTITFLKPIWDDMQITIWGS